MLKHIPKSFANAEISNSNRDPKQRQMTFMQQQR